MNYVWMIFVVGTLNGCVSDFQKANDELAKGELDVAYTNYAKICEKSVAEG